MFGRDADAARDVGEAPPAEQHFAHHQQRPALAEDLERARDRAVLIGEGTVGHEHSLGHALAKCKLLLYCAPGTCKTQPAGSSPMERRWQVLTVVSVAVFMVSLDLFIVNIAFPDIERAFHGSSIASVSWVLNAYAIVLASLLVSAGRLADRIGRRRIFLTGLVIFLAGSALCGAAPSIATLVAARIIQAIGAACLLPTSLALLLPEFPPRSDRRRSACGQRWAGSPRPRGRRSAACSCRAAGGWCSWSTFRSGWSRAPSRCACCARAATSPRSVPICSAR